MKYLPEMPYLIFKDFHAFFDITHCFQGLENQFIRSSTQHFFVFYWVLGITGFIVHFFG